MVRIIAAVVAGFVAWTILWLGSDQVLINLSRGWYGAHQYGFENAMYNQSAFAADNTILAMHLVRSIIFSIMAGFLAAVISGESRKAPLALGVLLFLFGAMIEGMAWSYLPLWYHLIFLLLLIPMAVLGGRLRPNSQKEAQFSAG